MPDIRATLWGIAGIVALGLAVMVWFLSERLDTVTGQLETATRQVQGLVVSMTELERNARAAAERDAVRVEVREAIVAAPAEDDGDVASVLLQGLDGADRIGGPK